MINLFFNLVQFISFFLKNCLVHIPCVSIFLKTFVFLHIGSLCAIRIYSHPLCFTGEYTLAVCNKEKLEDLNKAVAWNGEGGGKDSRIDKQVMKELLKSRLLGPDQFCRGAAPSVDCVSCFGGLRRRRLSAPRGSQSHLSASCQVCNSGAHLPTLLETLGYHLRIRIITVPSIMTFHATGVSLSTSHVLSGLRLSEDPRSGLSRSALYGWANDTRGAQHHTAQEAAVPSRLRHRGRRQVGRLMWALPSSISIFKFSARFSAISWNILHVGKLHKHNLAVHLFITSPRAPFKRVFI